MAAERDTDAAGVRAALALGDHLPVKECGDDIDVLRNSAKFDFAAGNAIDATAPETDSANHVVTSDEKAFEVTERIRLLGDGGGIGLL